MPDDTRDEDDPPLSATELHEAERWYREIEAAARGATQHFDFLVRTGRNGEARAQLGRMRVALQHLNRTADRFGQEDLVEEIVANVARRIADGEDETTVVGDELAYMAAVDASLAMLFTAGTRTGSPVLIDKALDRRALLLTAARAKNSRNPRPGPTQALFDLVRSLGLGGDARDAENWRKGRRTHSKKE